MRVLSRMCSVVLAASAGLDEPFLLSGSTTSKNHLIKAAFGYTPPPADDSDGTFTDESAGGEADIVTVVDEKGELVPSAGDGLGNDPAAASYLHLSMTELNTMFHKVAAEAAHRQKTESRTLTPEEIEKLVSGVVVTKAKTSGIKTSDYTKKKKKMTAGDDSFMEVDRNKDLPKFGFPFGGWVKNAFNEAQCGIGLKDFITKAGSPCAQIVCAATNVVCNR